MKKLITIIYFQIGVNIIGIPEIFKHTLTEKLYSFVSKSKYF